MSLRRPGTGWTVQQLRMLIRIDQGRIEHLGGLLTTLPADEIPYSYHEDCVRARQKLEIHRGLLASLEGGIAMRESESLSPAASSLANATPSGGAAQPADFQAP